MTGYGQKRGAHDAFSAEGRQQGEHAKNARRDGGGNRRSGFRGSDKRGPSEQRQGGRVDGQAQSGQAHTDADLAYSMFSSGARAILIRLRDEGLLLDGDLRDSVKRDVAEYEDAEAVMRLFDSALRATEVKNKSAYLSGVLWRHRRFDKGPKLPIEIHKRLDAMYRTFPALKDRWLDGKALETLAGLDAVLANRALNLFESKDLTQIRNLSGLFMACLKAARMDPVSGMMPIPQGTHVPELQFLEPLLAMAAGAMPFVHANAPGSGGMLPNAHMGGGNNVHGDAFPDGRGDSGRNFDSRFGGGRQEQGGMAGGGPRRGVAGGRGGHGDRQGPRGDRYEDAGFEGAGGLHGGMPGRNHPPPPQPPPLLQQGQHLQQEQQQQGQLQGQQQLDVFGGRQAVLPVQVVRGLLDYSDGQLDAGVRIHEFHDLSEYARHVHPRPALKLQHLWDSGNRLVSLLDDSAWKMLAELDGSDALAVVEDTSTAMAQEAIEDVNGLIASLGRKYLPQGRAPGLPFGPMVRTHELDQQTRPAPPMQGSNMQGGTMQGSNMMQGNNLMQGGMIPGGLGQAGMMAGGMQGHMGGGTMTHAPMHEHLPGFNAMDSGPGFSPGMSAALGAPGMHMNLGMGMPTGMGMGMGMGMGSGMAGGREREGSNMGAGYNDSTGRGMGVSGGYRGGDQRGGGGRLTTHGSGGRGPGGEGVCAIHMLPPGLRVRVERLLQQRSPFLLEHHFDEPVVRMMLRLPDESSAMSVLDELGANDLSLVKNIAAYLMGIMKRMQPGGKGGAGGKARRFA